MLTTSSRLISLTACGLVLLAGCHSSTTTAMRMQEKSSLLTSLPEEQQKKISGGVVEVGYTADMVYVALGRPSRVSVTTDGRVGIWTYEHYLPSEAVSTKPFYTIRGYSKGSGAFRGGPSAASAHDNAPHGNINRGPREGGPLGSQWAEPDIVPVTLEILFKKGRVYRMEVVDGSA
ncbi:MAG: hypothetical protein JWM35_934 [Verrucomicrobia bacterium]|nr:hypothetical protein [Verrucomicrobiota bacterium]